MGRGNGQAQHGSLSARDMLRRDRRAGTPPWVPKRRETVEVLSSNGKTFLVRLVRHGERYGLRDGLVNEHPDTLVEFYDTQFNGDEFGPRGQFVARFHLRDLAGHPAGSALVLDGGVPKWTVSADAMRAVRTFLDEQQRL